MVRRPACGNLALIECRAFRIPRIWRTHISTRACDPMLFTATEMELS